MELENIEHRQLNNEYDKLMSQLMIIDKVPMKFGGGSTAYMVPEGLPERNIHAMNRSGTNDSRQQEKMVEIDRLVKIPIKNRTWKDVADLLDIVNYVRYGPEIVSNYRDIQESKTLITVPITDIMAENDSRKAKMLESLRQKN